MALTPRQKLIGAILSLGAVVAMASAPWAWGMSSAARLSLVASALAGLVAWRWGARERTGSTVGRAPPRLKVIQRLGLSPRSGLALVEVDGRAFIVVHGDGFARIHPAHRRATARRLPRLHLQAPELAR